MENDGRSLSFWRNEKSNPTDQRKMLTQHLRELETDGLITRTIYLEMTPRVEYTLTELGLSLQPILKQLNDWGENTRKIKSIV